MKPPRPYQASLISAGQQALLRGRRGVLLQLAAGAGKTHVGLHLASWAIDRGREQGSGGVLWLARLEELITQPRDRILEMGWPIQDLAVCIGGRRSGYQDAPLVIASIDTARLRPHLLPDRLKLIVLDEARHFVSKEWLAFLKGRYSSVPVIGLDATPARPDGVSLRPIFDTMIHGPSVAQLIVDGFLVRSRVVAPPEYQENIAADPLDAYRQWTPNGHAILFAPTVADAKRYAERFTAGGVRAEALDANSGDRREAAVRAFLRGDIMVLCVMGLFKEGFDAPICDTVINVSKCGSLTDWIQRCARSSRVYPGKDMSTIIDLHRDVELYGMPDDPHEWTLDGGGRLREGLEPLCQCLKCFAWGRGGVCAVCGGRAEPRARREPRVDAAELEEVRRAAERAAVLAEPEAERRGVMAVWAAAAVKVGLRGARAVGEVGTRYRARYGEEAGAGWARAAVEEAERADRAREAEERRAREEPLFARPRGSGGSA